MENTFKISRQQLYEEIWDISTSKVAKKYSLSYVKLQQACKKANIPLPTAQYWGKYYAGVPVEKTPLSISENIDIEIEKVNSRSFKNIAVKNANATPIPAEQTIRKQERNQIIESTGIDNLENTYKANLLPEKYSNKLQFLPDNERQKVLEFANGFVVNPNKQLHKTLKKHKEDVIAWRKKYPYDETKTRKRDAYTKAPVGEPLLYRDIAVDSIPRVCKLLNTLFYGVEKLGGKVNDDLSLTIRNEVVSFSIVESENKVAHVWTKKETEDYKQYEKDKKTRSYAWEPRIRKWDFIFNGKLRFIVPVGIEIRDTDIVKLEDCVGDILVALYEESENSRILREAQEEKERIEAEERRVKEEKRQLYDSEIEKTIALVNEAEIILSQSLNRF